MGALAPIANLIGFSTGGALGAGGGQQATPPIDNFFGLDSRFLRAPAGGTALFNDILFGASNQQVGVDFKRLGFYTGVPPIFGGTGFMGLPAAFDFFGGGSRGAAGVEGVLELERLVNGGGGTTANGGTSGTSGRTGTTGNKGESSAGTRTNNSSRSDSKSDSEKKASSSNKSKNEDDKQFSLTDLKSMSLGDLMELLA